MQQHSWEHGIAKQRTKLYNPHYTLPYLATAKDVVMTRKQFVIKARYFVWRYSIEDDPRDQLQQGIQEYIKKYQTNPYLVLIPKGLHLLSPMSGFEVKQDEQVPPFRFYFALQEDDE